MEYIKSTDKSADKSTDKSTESAGSSERILSTIGLCRRAGKLIMGFDAVTAELKGAGKKVKGVLLAEDLSEKTKKEVRYYCDRAGIAAAEPGVTLDELKKILGKRSGVIAVTDEGLFLSVAGAANADGSGNA